MNPSRKKKNAKRKVVTKAPAPGRAARMVAAVPATDGYYDYDDVPLANWNNPVWRATYLGQQAQLRRFYIRDEPDGPGMQRVHFVTLPPGVAEGGHHDYDDVPLANWNNPVWRAAYLGQQAQMRRYYVRDEPDGPGMQRVHFFTPSP